MLHSAVSRCLPASHIGTWPVNFLLAGDHWQGGARKTRIAQRCDGNHENSTTDLARGDCRRPGSCLGLAGRFAGTEKTANAVHSIEASMGPVILCRVSASVVPDLAGARD